VGGVFSREEYFAAGDPLKEMRSSERSVQMRVFGSRWWVYYNLGKRT